MGTPLDRDSQALLLRPGLGSSRKEILPGEVCSNKKLKSLDKSLVAGALYGDGAELPRRHLCSISDNIIEIICRSNSGRVTKMPGLVPQSQVPQVIAR